MSTVTLNDCDREPIHIPGSIQPHGALLAYARESGVVTHASENLEDWIGVPAEEALGRNATQHLSYVAGRRP